MFPFARRVSERGHGTPGWVPVQKSNRKERSRCDRASTIRLLAPLSIRSLSKIAHIQRIDCGPLAGLSPPPRREQAPIPFLPPLLVDSPRHPTFLQSPAINSDDRRRCPRDQSRSRLKAREPLIMPLLFQPPPPPCVKCGTTTVIAPAFEEGQRVFVVRCPACGRTGAYSLDYARL
jgi:hypothetical protein